MTKCSTKQSCPHRNTDKFLSYSSWTSKTLMEKLELRGHSEPSHAFRCMSCVNPERRLDCSSVVLMQSTKGVVGVMGVAGPECEGVAGWRGGRCACSRVNGCVPELRDWRICEVAILQGGRWWYRLRGEASTMQECLAKAAVLRQTSPAMITNHNGKSKIHYRGHL
ncbi:hypothetical protein NEOLEDRAFT_275532 [Neolentinus lepideus HHB14362 ss-1]|uniref:Uncharacterized protein n=1 Tax=Neolentinus lepideus HHB14362 ss-1 TaxID=1314782 RepID=A0A165T608_9AGAM|nr:hypothetical protein NEOLEDRAFT_275532 [Neolentinus lepideus HHB14362 ss-1]